MLGFKLLRPAMLVAGLLLGCGCATAARPTHGAGATFAHSTAAKSAPVAEEDCFAVGDVKARELCFSKKPDDEIADCERVRLHACKPYRDMYRLDQQLAALTQDASAKARKQYASYANDDPAYLDDLSAYQSASDKAWAASRDADCLLEPFAQGMSRREAADLTEACRVERTQARIAYLKEFFASLK